MHKRIPLQPTSFEIWQQKYQLRDQQQNPVDLSVSDSFDRVATALSACEKDPAYWKARFRWALFCGATPAANPFAASASFPA